MQVNSNTVVINSTDTTNPIDTTTVSSGWYVSPVTIDVAGTDVGAAGMESVQWRISQFGVPGSGTPIQTVSGDHAEVTFDQEGIWRLETNVRDPGLRERLRPEYRAACKRLIISPDFYDAIQKPNAELVNGSSRLRVL